MTIWSRINNQFSVGLFNIMDRAWRHHGGTGQSAHLSESVRAHDSQVRGVLSKLVKAGGFFTETSRGPANGFSSLARPANKISMLEIYKAVRGRPHVFSIQGIKRKDCRTSCTQKQAMVELLEDTQREVEARLGPANASEMVQSEERQVVFLIEICPVRVTVKKQRGKAVKSKQNRLVTGSWLDGSSWGKVILSSAERFNVTAHRYL